MKWSDATAQNCPIAQSLAIFGDRWTLLIIRNAFLGTTRFEQFQKSLGMTRHILSERLNRLVEQGIFQKQAYVERQQRFEYVLTEKGQALAPVLMAMMKWGLDWTDAEVPESMQLPQLKNGA